MEQKTSVGPDQQRTGVLGPDGKPIAGGPEALDQQRQIGGMTATAAREHAPPLADKGGGIPLESNAFDSAGTRGPSPTIGKPSDGSGRGGAGGDGNEPIAGESRS